MLKVIRGHVSPETAYVVDDYPYGFRLRCKIRYWLERAEKGAAKGQYRLVSQTTDPKRGGGWTNKPKPSVYADFGVMVLDDDGHVGWRTLSRNMGPESWGMFVACGIYGQLNSDELAVLNPVVAYSRKYSPRSWGEWETVVALVRGVTNGESGEGKTADEVYAAVEAVSPVYRRTFDAAYAFVLATDSGVFRKDVVG